MPQAKALRTRLLSLFLGIGTERVLHFISLTRRKNEIKNCRVVAIGGYLRLNPLRGLFDFKALWPTGHKERPRHPPECRTIWQESKPFVCPMFVCMQRGWSRELKPNAKYLWGAETPIATATETDTGISFWHKQFTIKSSWQPKGQQCCCECVASGGGGGMVDLLPGKKWIFYLWTLN